MCSVGELEIQICVRDLKAPRKKAESNDYL